MNQDTAINPHAMAQAATLQQDNQVSNKSNKNDDAYKHILADQMSQLTEVCKMVGATDGKGGAVGESAPPAGKGLSPAEAAAKAEKEWRHHVLQHDPIMMALYLLLMSGGGSYGCLAKIMASLGVSMADVKKFVDDMKDVQDDINDLMTTKDPAQMAKDAADIEAKEKDLNSLIKEYGSKLGPELVKSLNSFANPGGSLDQVISEATKGKYKNWADAANDPAALKEIQKYLTGPGGGSAPSGVTTLFKNMSDLLGSLNTQNQGDVEKLNLVTKKVDALTKLFAASVTMFKGLTQTLTNFSGS